MTLTELVSEVYSLTKRPDLVGETLSAIKAATLRAHHLDFFYKDIAEQTIIFNTQDFYQQLAISQLPLYRALSYARKYYPGVTNDNSYQQGQPPLPPLWPWGYNPGGNLPDGRFLKILTPDNVLDGYGINKVDVAYAAGQTINIRSGDQFQYLLVGYYQHPNITQAAYSSWIAIENPYAIVVDATSVIFKTIGYDEQAQAYNAWLQQEQNQLILSNVQATGS